MAQVKEEDLKNLMAEFTSDIPQPKAKSDKKENETEEDQFYPHWKKEIYINLICDHS